MWTLRQPVGDYSPMRASRTTNVARGLTDCSDLDEKDADRPRNRTNDTRIRTDGVPALYLVFVPALLQSIPR